MEILNWINQYMRNIQESEKFKEYFAAKQVNNIEGQLYLSNSDKGIGIVMSDLFLIHSIHLFSGKVSGNKPYRDKKPFNLSFTMSKTDVFEILGTPNKKGGGYKEFWGDVPAWEKYYLETYTLHLQYASSDNSIELITIGSLSLEPYFDSNLQ